MLDRKKWAKKINEFLSSLKLNEIHIVYSPSNEDPKNIIHFQRGPNFGEGRPENLGKWAMTGTSIVMQIGGWSVSKGNNSPTPWYQNPCDASIFLNARPNLREKNEKTQFSCQTLTFL